MTTRSILVWIERGFVAVGLILGAWCVAVLFQMYRASHIATPAPPSPSAPSSPAPRTIVAGAWVARLEAPSASLSATVLEGSDDDVLRRAAGHIENTAFPGAPGNIGIAGHRDTTFRAVRHLRVGDPLSLTTAEAVFRYRITRTLIVDPTDVWVLDPTDHPTLTLVTCYPFTFIGHAPRRFIVEADLVSEEQRASEQASRAIPD